MSDEVEITPAMIEAGVDKLLLFEPADAEVAVYSIFKAMLLASRRFRNHQIFESELEDDMTTRAESETST